MENCSQDVKRFFHGTMEKNAAQFLEGSIDENPFLEGALGIFQSFLERFELFREFEALSKGSALDKFPSHDVNLCGIQKALVGSQKSNWSYGSLYATTSYRVARKYASRGPELRWMALAARYWLIEATGEDIFSLPKHEEIARLCGEPIKPVVLWIEVDTSSGLLDEAGDILSYHEITSAFEMEEMLSSLGGSRNLVVRIPIGHIRNAGLYEINTLDHLS